MVADTSQHRIGWLASWRAWLLGERDEIADQLQEVAKQGRGLARLAHVCAFGLIILFSLGSLVALSGDAVASLSAQFARHVFTPGAIPLIISVAVGVALVVAMDTGMLIAAATLRALRSRRATWGEMSIHAAILTTVAIIEAGTYCLMAWEYDRPATLAAMALIVARALAAPILSVYLSMAAPSPVSARDVLYRVEMSVGVGLIRDAVTIASDAQAPLHKKMRLYRAASLMQPTDAARLDGMIVAMQDEAPVEAPTHARAAPHTAELAPVANTPEQGVDAASEPAQMQDERPPTGPGAPAQVPPPARRARQPRAPILRLEPPTQTEHPMRKVASARGANTANTMQLPPEGYRTLAMAAWADGAQSISKMKAATGMSRTAAQAWVRTLKGAHTATTAPAPQADQQIAQ